MIEFFDSFLGELTPAQWDSWRNWLATIGGLVALFIAANTYRRNVRIKREEQARLVYSRLTHVNFYGSGEYFAMLPNGAQLGTASGVQIAMPVDPSLKASNLALAPVINVTAIVHNGSKELIGPVKVQMVNGGTDKIWADFSIQVDAIEPESDFVVDFVWPNEFDPGQPALATTLLFRDASGQWWRRHRAEPIERVHDDPENTLPSPAERRSSAAFAISIGLQPTVDPKPTIRVRWQRFWRKRRGLTPIP